MISKTKQKILDTSLNLFNEYGLSQITLRRIANELKMSQGNLNYHFKKREEIIEQLYHQLVLNIDKNIGLISLDEVSVKSIYTICKSILYQFYEYRFFLLDFTQIMREQSKIKTHYQQLLTIRKSQTLAIFQALIQKELIRSEELPSEYENLYTRIQILADFWMSSITIQDNPISKKTTEKYILIIFENLYPYLTKKGILEYQKIV